MLMTMAPLQGRQNRGGGPVHHTYFPKYINVKLPKEKIKVVQNIDAQEMATDESYSLSHFKMTSHAEGVCVCVCVCVCECVCV